MGMINGEAHPELHYPSGGHYLTEASAAHRSAHQVAEERISAELGGIWVVEFIDDWKQLVLRFPPGESGSNRYAVWVRDAPEVKYYSPEGLILGTWPCAGPDYAGCVEVARRQTGTPVVSVQFKRRIDDAD